jgi:hypothetical protein
MRLNHAWLWRRMAPPWSATFEPHLKELDHLLDDDTSLQRYKALDHQHAQDHFHGRALSAELKEQRLAIQPDGRALTSQPTLSVDTPVTKTDVAELIERPTKARGIEDPMQLGRIALHALYPSQDRTSGCVKLARPLCDGLIWPRRRGPEMVHADGAGLSWWDGERFGAAQQGIRLADYVGSRRAIAGSIRRTHGHRDRP